MLKTANKHRFGQSADVLQSFAGSLSYALREAAARDGINQGSVAEKRCCGRCAGLQERRLKLCPCGTLWLSQVNVSNKSNKSHDFILQRLTVWLSGSGGARKTHLNDRAFAGKPRSAKKRRSRCPLQPVLGGDLWFELVFFTDYRYEHRRHRYRLSERRIFGSV